MTSSPSAAFRKVSVDTTPVTTVQKSYAVKFQSLFKPSVILGGTLAVYLLLVVAYRQFTMDDAYISFRYAENWARGLGLVFNAGEAVEGYTNFLWVVLLGSIFKFGVPTIFAAKFLGACFGIGTLLVTYQVGSLIAPGDTWIQYLAAVLLVLYPGFAIWSASGLETVMFTFLVMLGLWLALSPGPRAPLFFGVVFALATLTRPEGPLFFGLALLNGSIWLVIRREEPTRRLHYVLYNLLPYLAVVGLWEWWRWSFYGYPLPNPFYMKVADADLESIGRGVWYVRLFFNSLGGWLVLGLSLLVVLTPSPRLWKTLYLSILFCWLIYVWKVDGDWMPWYRFFVPVLPLILLALQDAVSALGRIAPPFAAGLGAILLTFGALNAAKTLRTEAPIIDSHQVIQIGPGPDAVLAGLWLRKNAAAGGSVAVIAAGAIPYYSNLRALDYYGIVNPTIAHMPFESFAVDRGDGTSEEDLLRLDVNWLLDQSPTYFEIPGALTNDGSLAASPPSPPVARVVFSSTRFKQEYGTQPVFVSGGEMLFQHK